MSINELNNLDWQAFCYVANELPADERLDFENALAVDQVAREALARAVELSLVLSAAKSHDAKRYEVAVPAAAEPAGGTFGSNWSRRLSWMAIGAAASLLVAVLVSSLGDLHPLSAWLNPQSAEVHHDLATVWSDTRADLAPRENAWLEGELTELTEELAAAYSTDVDSIDSNVPETPSWMTAALLAQAGHSPEESLDGERLEN